MDAATNTTDESALIAKARGVPANDASSDETQTDHPPVLTNMEALGHVSELVNYATHTGNQAILEAVMTMQSLVQDHCIKQAAFDKQESITDLFTVQCDMGTCGDMFCRGHSLLTFSYFILR
ncbi:hypothetical protein NP493_246g01029 [Ridgeia piscesae]|uniref:Uncharacterized protein n=1 Tax=Ridgeia piscesae TaxID=27915 RepID=A0AAD9NYZ5_RIDPI|nr:hypothetical protein NP493_246g01029 [Ridgeia piscesae]